MVAMTIVPDQLHRILDLYEQGLYVQAYAISQELGPLAEWHGTDARLVAGRLAAQVGAPRLARRLHRLAWREDRAHPEACYYRARARLEHSGPLAAWEFLRRRGDLPEAPVDLRGNWLALRASVAAHLRDFDTADLWIARAREMATDDPWIFVEQSSILELEDRYEEALAAARHSLTLQPWFRPAVQATAHLLQLLSRDDEALALLSEAAGRIESAAVLTMLTLVQTEQGRWADARESLDRFEALSPLMEKEVAQWLAGRRSDVAYHCGDRKGAIHHARLADDPFHTAIADRLSVASDRGCGASDGPNAQSTHAERGYPTPNPRVLLPVGFIRQHHMTCAPATLAALSRYWSMPADHLGVVEAICYDGTPDHSERHWAEQNGWATREFTVTWESAVSLLDRGIPFTFATSDATTGHLQAVIGYDAHRRTLLIRDPYMRHFGEALAEELLSHLRSTGPRGMALVPREKAGLLETLDLPDAPLYDQYHRLQRALQQHDRPEAQRIYEGLRETAPDHRLTQQARRSLAAYDSDPTELLACAERMLELYPDDGNLQLLKLSCLRDLARRDERLALLQGLCAKKETHPVFRQQYAQELAPDAREHPRAIRLLRRCIRVQPGEGGSQYLLARILWDQRRFEEALALFRFAACLEDTNEVVAQGYFFASRHLKQTEATVQFLASRFRRFGTRSSQPARTLYWALSEIDQTPKAFEVLEEALRLRPDDGELQLFAAQAHSHHGEFERAARHLAAAEGKTQRTEWLRAAASLAQHRGDLKDALALRQQVVTAEPLDVEGQRMVAQLLAATESHAAALAYLRDTVARFPHHYLLHQLWIEWLREEGEEDSGSAATEPDSQSKTQNPKSKIESAVRHLIEINPVDAWAHQELALVLGNQGRLEEAFAESETAGRLDPTSPGRWCVHGQVCSMAGLMKEARQAYRQAIQLSVDTDYAIWALVEVCDTPAQRREALAFIEGELVRQTTLGDGLLAFRERARAVLAPEELLITLRRALRARPDLWHAWSAVVKQLTDMDQLDEADSLARQATARFPLLPRVWLDLAVVSRARGERAAELEALRNALRISPGWSAAVGQLASLHERSREFDEAKTLLEESVARSPLDPLCRGWLAQILWQLDEKEEALQQVERALELEPGYEWAWNSLTRWSHEQDHGERAVAFARRLAARRPGEARSWMMLARTLTGEAALPERLAAADRAISLSPRNTEAYELKAEILTEAGRFEEALAACRPELWGAEPPSPLRARAALVEAERGNMRGAIAQMRALVADDPHDARGWAELARWYDQGGANAEYLEAAQQMARLEPLNPRSFAILADARIRNGDRRGAKEAFGRAFDLAPEYAFAGMSLFDAQLEDRELLEAGQTLERLRTHIGGEWVLAREVQLHALRREQDAATRAMRDLCLSPGEDTWPFFAAAQAMSGAGWNDALNQLFDEMLDRPEVNPQVGALWVRSRIAQNDWKCAARLEALRDRGAVGRAATAAYLEVLAESNRTWMLQRFLKQHAGLLRRDTATWASAGYALLTVGDVRRTALWLADWQSRPDAEPWMLVPIAVALRATGREAEAAAVSRHALTRPQDARTACHAIWLAVDAALAGSTEEAANLLASFDPAEQNPYYQFLHALAGAAVQLQATEPAAREPLFAQLRQRLQKATPSQGDMTCPAMKRFHRRLLRRIARDAGSLRAKLWLWGQLLRYAHF
jgi:cellulose synthase operon protein C